MVKCPTCKNFLLEKRAEFPISGNAFIARYFCHECRTEFETRFNTEKEIEDETLKRKHNVIEFPEKTIEGKRIFKPN